ncbi:hypothetical protein DBR32_06245 [Taibaiella sp. KBW10]|uniref:hypothetical protein n=1 Tax=Taibaiella sp. KBW10 TaxID=2153357 RepID=UPI000F59D748|nr:hypothetical protein [Taibaiella sp. KBW10]RQO31555.1 hypothetical protein DBR32_06245 [Taibaiella sp. KBW10]
MDINSSNIIDFIKYLYQKRLSQEASEDVLSSWSGLNDVEVQQYLDELFKTWNYTEADAQQEIKQYFESKAGSIPVAVPSPPTTTPNPAPAGNTNRAYVPTNAPAKKSSKTWLLLLFIPVLAIGAYLLYQYKQFKGLGYLYVTTDNVTIRDIEGNALGRMDIYPTANSVSYLRTTDKQSYNIKVNDKMYACRKVVFDSTRFNDYLFNNPKAFGYVNENYVIDDKDNFLVYRNVFREINNAKNESAGLTSPFRKVVVGSIKQAPALQKLYIVNTCSNSNKTYSALIKQTLKDNVYGIVAQLSDGGYYMFYGNPETNTYEAPRPLRYKTAYTDAYTDLKNDNTLFKFANDTYFLFNCDGSAKEYYTKFDNSGKIEYVKYALEP